MLIHIPICHGIISVVHTVVALMKKWGHSNLSAPLPTLFTVSEFFILFQYSPVPLEYLIKHTHIETGI